MRAASVSENFDFNITTLNPPKRPTGGALIKLLGCGLCGSDLEKLMHKKAEPGSVLGHEVVGTITELCPTYQGDFSVGDRIVTSHHVPCLTCQYCLNDAESMCRDFKRSNLAPGGFSEIIALTEGHLNHTAFKVPHHITHAEASCVEPLSCVVKGVRRSGTIKGNGHVLIIGLGFIGLLAAQLYHQQGHAVYGVDINDEKIKFANEQDWFTAACQPNQLNDHLPVSTPDNPFVGMDTVFVSIVLPQTLKQTFNTIRDGGTIVQFSRAFSPEAQYNPDELYYREIQIVPSYSPSLIDLNTAAQLIFSKEINVAPLCTHQFTLENANQALDAYRSGQAIKALLVPS